MSPHILYVDRHHHHHPLNVDDGRNEIMNTINGSHSLYRCRRKRYSLGSDGDVHRRRHRHQW